MSYKSEKQSHTAKLLSTKISGMPLFIRDFFSRQKSKGTSNVYWGCIRDLLQWFIDNGYILKSDITNIVEKDLDNIKSSNVIAYLDDLKNGTTVTKNKGTTLATKKNIIGAFWSYLATHHYVYDNIVLLMPKKLFSIEVPNKTRGVKIPTQEELENFLANLENKKDYASSRNYAIVKLILGSGIRSEELINMDKADIHLNARPPHINILGKGNQEEYDTVYITNEAKEVMRDYMKIRNRFAKTNNVDDDAVFLSSWFNRISKSAITDFFNKKSDGTINPHMLRHWVGTMLYRKTKDIVLVQKQLRHKNFETAVKYYVCIEDDTVAEAMAEL